MKTLKSGILSLGLASLLFGCHTKERAQLRHQVDSLNYELQASKKVEKTMEEVGVLIDSIDASRQALNTKMVEGTSYSDYVNRLKDINTHIRDSKRKLDEMEKSAKSSNVASANTIRRLKADLDLRAKEILSLQMDVANMQKENKSLVVNISQLDSAISTKDQTIKMREGDITTLQGQVKDITEENKIKVANLYFAQAQALETAANRTKFAPKRKKETRREALELYKLSLFLGKTEAQQRIETLEKDLS